MMTDGSIHAHFGWSELPKELYRMMTDGVLDSLSIGPNIVRATPAPRELAEGFKFQVPERMKQAVERVLTQEEERRKAGGILNLMKQKLKDEALKKEQHVDKNLSYAHPYDQNLRISRAIELVYQYVKDHLDVTDTHVTFGIDEVFVVWFCKTLQNWKALLSTTLPDGMYYEVTYDGDVKRTYIDAYKKFDNKVIVDDEPTSIAYAQAKSTEFGNLSQRPDPRPEPERTKDLSQYKNVVVPEIPAGDDRFA
jgi:hypothetical protein